jgi:hypothetical protein
VVSSKVPAVAWGNYMTTLVLLLVLGLTPLPQDPPQEERPRVPKDSIELVITGCLKGRLLIVSDLRQTDTQAGPIIRAKTFRLAGKGEVMKAVKKEDRHLVDVIGVVKKSALIEPGVKVGKGIVIGGGQPTAGSGMRSSPNPSEFIPVLDVETVRLRSTSCSG